MERVIAMLQRVTRARFVRSVGGTRPGAVLQELARRRSSILASDLMRPESNRRPARGALEGPMGQSPCRLPMGIMYIKLTGAQAPSQVPTSQSQSDSVIVG